MNATIVRAYILDLIKAKAALTPAHAARLERKIDTALQALMRGQVENAAVAADEASAFLASVT